MQFGEKHVLTLCLLSSVCVGYYFFELFLPAAHEGALSRELAGGYEYGNDFYQIWLTTQELLAHRTDPYSPAMQQKIETGLYGRTLDRSARRDAAVPYRGYSYPLQANLLLAPLGLLSFEGVQIVLSVLLPICVALAVVCWCWVYGLNFSGYTLASVIVIALGTCPVLEGIYALQPTLIVAAILAGAMLLLRRNWLLWAGILLALGSMKPHLIVPLAVWLALWSISDWPRRRAFLISFAVASAGLLLATQIWVPGWWLGWWHSLSAYRELNTPPLMRLVLGTAAGYLASFLLIIFGIAAAIRFRRCEADSSSFLLVSAFVLAITVVVGSSSIAVYDQFLLFPAILWLWCERRAILRSGWPARVITLLGLGTFLWPWATASLLTITSPVLSWARSFRAVLLPLATAASFPLITLLLLTLMAWEALRTVETPERQFPREPVSVRSEP
jgi:Glycosyltransferase family 87